MEISKKMKYIMAPFPEFSKVTNEVVKINKGKKFTGGVRIQKGLYRTETEANEYIRKSLERKLP